MKRYQKIMLANILINLSLYLIVYLIKSFIIWEFTNPVRWIINIPKYGQEARGFILFAYILYQSILLGAIMEGLFPNSKAPTD